MPRTCIFCDSPLTGVRAEEHVIPRWLMEYLGVTDDQLYLAVANSQDDTIVKDRTLVAGNFVEGRVCGDCNNGWMNNLEKQTRELLKPLIEGTTNLLSISDDERTTLAKWATKTGYVLSHAAPLKKVPPPSHMRYVRDNAGARPAASGSIRAAVDCYSRLQTDTEESMASHSGTASKAPRSP